MADILFNKNLSTNPNYLVNIKCPSAGLNLYANLPETFAFSVDANYSPKLPNSLGDIAQGRLFTSANLFFKLNRVLQAFSFQVWESSSPVEFSIPLQFDAKTNARSEVQNPIKELMKLTLPYKENANDVLLLPPGPVLGDNKERGRISIKIGRFFYVHSVLLTSVNPTFDMKPNKEGVPISATCDVSLRTVNTPVREDIDAFFLSSSTDQGNTTYGQLGDVGEQLGKFKNQILQDATDFGGDELAAIQQRLFPSNQGQQ